MFLFGHPFTKNKYESLIRLFYSGACFWINNYLKLIFKEARPYMYSMNVVPGHCECNFGKPSGHAQCSVMFLMIVLSFPGIKNSQRRLIKLLFFLALVSVCWSRFYYGMHTFTQLALGTAWGLWLFFLFQNLRRIGERSLLKFLIKARNPLAFMQRNCLFGFLIILIFIGFGINWIIIY